MSKQTFIIYGQLPSLNEYLAAERRNRFMGNKIKREVQSIIADSLEACEIKPVEKPIWVTYQWCEKTRRRDKDNIAFGKKFIQDALVENGIIENDGWGYIVGFTDNFSLDPKLPRIEVTIEEVG